MSEAKETSRLEQTQEEHTTDASGVTPSHSRNSTGKEEFPVLPIEELPEEYRKLHQEFLNLLSKHKPTEARLSLRPLIAYYIKLKREIPVSIEVAYGKLLVLEELEKSKKS
jgi:hypothetical protein